MDNYELLLQKCEGHIREGRPRLVAQSLTNLNTNRIPREWRLPLANICRRAGLLSLGLKLLERIVHPYRKKNQTIATPQERAGFAMLLLRHGAISEAVQELELVSPESVPEVLLYRSFAHFLNWEYPQSIPLLERYIRMPLAPYAGLVALSNLAFAKVEVREHAQAQILLQEIIARTSEAKHYQLQSTAHILRAQVFIQNNQELAKARREVDAADRLISLAQGPDHFAVMKWKLILQALENQNSSPLEQLHRLAVQNHDWEACREADLYALKIKFERERFLKLYFGSPFPLFRELICAEFGERPGQSEYILGARGGPCLDLSSGTVDGRPTLIPGRKRHQMMSALLRDFYRPLRIGGLFSELFPSQFFDISSSPDRVRQILSRTRRWLADEKIQARIVEQDQFYSFVIDGRFAVRLEDVRKVEEPFTQYYENLRAKYSMNEQFLAKDAEKILGLPKWTVHKLIKWGIETGKIVRLGGTNRAASYQIPATEIFRKVA